MRFFFGLCSHSKTSFPQTPKRGPLRGRTYVACLDCGKEFDYTLGEGRGKEIRLERSQPVTTLAEKEA